MHAAHHIVLGASQGLHLLQRGFIQRCRAVPQTAQQNTTALPFQWPLMDVLPGALLVVQQPRLESIGATRMDNAPLLARCIPLDGIVLAIDGDELLAIHPEKTVRITRVLTVLGRAGVRVMLDLPVPQPGGAIFAADRFKILEKRSGGLAQAAGSLFECDAARHSGRRGSNIQSNVEHVLTCVIDIAMGPIINPFVDFTEHLPHGNRQHHPAKHRDKQRRHVNDKQADTLIELPLLLAFLLVQHPRRHGQHPGVGKHVLELDRTQVMRGAHAQGRGHQAQPFRHSVDLLQKAGAHAKRDKPGKELDILRPSQSHLQLINEHLQ